MNPSEREPKQEVDQIEPETGMSVDWSNEVFGLALALQRTGDINEVVAMIRKRPRRKYEERFPLSIYTEVVTKQNEGGVRRLDELVDRLNNMANVGTLTREEFVSIYNKMNDLLRGRGAKHIS
ncbi:MAG: hypothetical protein HY433_01055 [Candidatus Liptonbacteria bacterium]|nr:hypothetical protein [Candidatus Liptonbacteria bacterium]